MNRSISPALDRIVRHCLEKDPDQRFQSARDLAFDLESVAPSSKTSVGMVGRPSAVQQGAALSVGDCACAGGTGCESGIFLRPQREALVGV